MTYGRIPLLEESIESFLRQEHDNSELVVINDHFGNKLYFDHPRVRIFNVDERFSTLGDKRNFGVAACFGRKICVWDDDDIYLPGHIAKCERTLEKNDHVLFDSYFLSLGNKIKKVVRLYLHPNSAYTKDLWHEVVGYPPRTAAEDREFDRKVKKVGKWNKVKISPSQITHIRREQTGFYNLSQLDWDYRWDQVEDMVVGVGETALNPHWKRDYIQDAGNFI